MLCFKEQKEAETFANEWNKTRMEAWSRFMRTYDVPQSQPEVGPTGREYAGVCMVGSNLYVYGGEDKIKFYDDFYTLSLGTLFPLPMIR